MVRCATLVKQLDCYLGLPSVVWDRDAKRRQMYGAAGAFRPKPYGVEYRVLSNAWLLNEKRMRFVFNQTVKAVNDLISGFRPVDSIGADYVRRIINGSNHYAAADMVRNYLSDGPRISKELLTL